MKRVVLASLALLLLLTACSTNQPSNEVVDLPFVTGDKANFRVIVSSESEAAPSLGRTIAVALRSVIGADFSCTSDAMVPASAQAEILVGNTNRPESQQAMQGLAAGDYVICVSGNKLVIAAGSDLALNQAVDVFLKDIVLWRGKSDFTANAALSVRSDLRISLSPSR